MATKIVLRLSSHRMTDIITNAFKRHQEIVELSLGVIIPEVDKASKIIFAAAKENSCIFTCGNGGSAADSQHLSGEFLCRYKNDRRPIKSIALTTDTSALTAISNDYSFDLVFARKIRALGNPGDVLLAFTTSGRSKNILAAIKQAKEQHLSIIVFTGEDSQHFNDIADVVLAVPTKETARIQEVHQIIYHSICECVDKFLETQE